MQRPAFRVQIASILALFAFGSAAGCGGDPQTTGSGGTGGTTSSTTTGTGAMGGSGGGGMGGSGGNTGGSGGIAGMGGTGGTGGATGGGGTGGGMMPLDPVIDCNAPDIVPPADPNATCELKVPGTSGILLRGTVLLPDQIMHKGEVLIAADGKIACADCDCSLVPGADTAALVECADGVISPGLINSHDHITFSNNPPKPHGTERFEHRHDWRIGQNGHTKVSYNSGASANVQLLQELRFLMSGATSVSGSNGAVGLLRNLDHDTKKEGLVMPSVLYETFPLGDSGGFTDNNAGNGCGYTNTDSASFVAKQNAYEPHIAEGIGATANTEFVCSASPPPPANAVDLLESQTAIVHAVGITATDAQKIRNAGAKVVWSARTNVDLYGNTAPATLLDTLGVPLAIGTDWIVSGSMNMLRELRCVDDLNTTYYDKHFTDKQIWQMVTTNGAFALGGNPVLGMIKPGFVGDISVWNGKTNKDYRAVVGADLSDVVLVLRAGEALYGDADLVADLRPTDNCEPLMWDGGGNAALAFNDVCGLQKRACVNADVPTSSLNAVLASSATNYPLFFQCGQVPTNEPSCVPLHEQYPAGLSGTIYNGIPQVDDIDGDGIVNDMDNCPSVFNPVRPMDAGLQPDNDLDGLGDACDPCPFDSMDGCTPVSSNDVDGDSWLNSYDNCPYIANVDQADSDKDGHGDACDKCPTEANPEFALCPAVAISIKAIRDPSDPNHPAMGTEVLVKDAYVTAVDTVGSTRGFFIQDTSLMPYTALFVYTGGTSPTVQVGNRVDVQGTYEEFFMQTELTSPTVTVTDPGTVLPIMPIDIANPASIATGGAMAEGYESMLLKIGAVTIVNMNPDGASDFDEFSVTGNLRIDDQCYDALNNLCAIGTPFDSITGVLTYTFSNFKLLPRNAADIVQPAGAMCAP